MSDEHFYMIYYGFIFFIIFFIVTASLLGMYHSNFNFSEEKLKSMKKTCKKGIILYSIIAFLLPTLLIPLYIYSVKGYLLIQLIIIIFSLTSWLLFVNFLWKYWKIRKMLRNGVH